MTGRPIWWEIGPDDIVAVDLPEQQRDLTIEALSQWRGPTRPTDAIAGAMGFANAEAIEGEGERLRAALRERRDIVTGWSDEHTLQALRSLQRTLNGLRAPPRHIGGLQDPFAEPDD